MDACMFVLTDRECMLLCMCASYTRAHESGVCKLYNYSLTPRKVNFSVKPMMKHISRACAEISILILHALMVAHDVLAVYRTYYGKCASPYFALFVAKHYSPILAK